jgi:hypothetical protein
MANSICFNFYTQRLDLLISTLTPQGNDIMNVESKRLNKNEIEHFTSNQWLGTLTKYTRKITARKNKLHFHPTKKRRSKADVGVHDDNTVDSSEYE